MATMKVDAGAGTQANLYVVHNKLGFLKKARSKLVFDPVTKDATLPQGIGSITARWHRMTDLDVATTPLLDGQNPGEDTLADAEQVDVTIQWYGSFIKISDKLDLTKPSGTMEEYRDILARQAAATKNRLIQTEALTTSSIIRCGGQGNDLLAGAVAGSSKTLALRDVARVRFNFKTNNIDPHSASPGGAFYLMMIDEKQVFDLTTDAIVTAGQADVFWQDIAKYISPGDFLSGSPGAIMGVAMKSTTEIDTITDSGQTVNRCLAFGDESIGALHLGGRSSVEIINKKSGPNDTGNALNMFQTFGWKFKEAHKLLRSTALFKVYAA